MTTNTGLGIVQAAYEDAGRCAVGQIVNVGQIARGLEKLNDIIALESTQGLKVWLHQDVAVPLVANQASYSIGPGKAINMNKPLAIVQGYYLPPSGNQQPLNGPLSRDEYTRLLQPTVFGAINSFYPERKPDWYNVFFWNTPDAQAATGVAHLICRVSLSPLMANTSTQFPQEWMLYLRWALAADLATGLSQEITSRCDQKAASFREQLSGYDVEEADTYFQPKGYGPAGGFR